MHAAFGRAATSPGSEAHLPGEGTMPSGPHMERHSQVTYTVHF